MYLIFQYAFSFVYTFLILFCNGSLHFDKAGVKVHEMILRVTKGISAIRKY